ncbi:sensor histidine kinase [Nocardia terpenica]|uniref:histidine kinase n=1 Tax=Nocardia terpenica TaxID=455432 RepID=A0A164J134_9NOCA|nr:sensor domain-containing protein [Nocardia terpenica]KZM69937.1 hypothetical protein AWN90_04845 [Nocardia terpenica]NQE91302.1 sensor histidine kinase [Nocardia terpenica]
MTTRDSATSIPVRLLRPWRSATLWSACAHVAVDGLVAVLGVLAVTAFGVSMILVPVGLGIPMVPAARWTLYGLAAFERARFAAVGGRDIPAPPRPDLSGPITQAARRLVTDRTLWRHIAYFVLLVPVAALTLAGTLIIWSVPLAVLLLPVADPHAVGGIGVAIAITVATLAVGIVAAPPVMRMLLALDNALAAALLAPSPHTALTQRVEHLQRTRAATVEAAEAERRRIERDLHDGAQQRLVALSIMLGRISARLKKAGDLETRDLVEDAKRTANEAITELRNLTRGLHPPVLTDRGLDAALSAVAAQCPIPVTVDVRVVPRPSITVESIAYFVVTEALTNVAKHSRAERAWVAITRTGDRLTVKVTDNGVGGANPAHGSGLRGLTDRVAGVDGRLRLVSPAGGPTVVEVEFACE